MQKITKTLSFFPLLLTGIVHAQIKPAADSSKSKYLNEVVVTGQFQPQSIKNSVYNVAVINNQRIRLSGATNVQQVLNNQLGFRFSNDNTLGTTDVQLMGISGRNVKVLLDGVPLNDRGDTRESINQIDINSIDRIEIVEGPMSVSYGSDALGGTINIITKRNLQHQFSVTARVQEETAGSEYYPFSYQGVHTQNIGLNAKQKNWSFSLGGTHNDHDGFGGDQFGRAKTWKPKEQWLGNARIGYANDKFNVYYRLDALDETILSRGAISMVNYRAVDQKYVSNRYMQQLQGDFKLNKNLQMSTIVAYTNYQRATETRRRDFQVGTNELTTGAGEQDVAKLNSFTFRNTFNYKLSSKVSLQPGIDINADKASGQRINGVKEITDYALFVSSEIKPNSWINIRPGLRFIKNAVYDAPPVVPAINTKFILNKELDLRLSYAYGFRSPALRELYFLFVDANHNINGNPDLKAEYSNSFNGSLTWTPASLQKVQFNTTLGAFYNSFENQIQLTSSAADPNLYSYFNVDRSRTAGATLNNRISYKNLEASLGFIYTAFDQNFLNEKSYVKEDNRDFLWTPEINSNIIYAVKKIKTKFGLFYKFVGEKPAFNTGTNSSNQPAILLSKIASYNLADLTATTTVNKYISGTIGVKNLFDVRNVNNNAISTGTHSGAGSFAIGYGRSYFIGINLQLAKK